VLVSHVTRQPPAVRSVAPQVPADVALIVDRLLRKSPADRCANAAELITALHAADVREGGAGHADVAVSPTMSSAEAHEVWERAAMLQQMTGAHAPPTSPLVSRPPMREQPKGAPATSGYRMQDVVAAAQEAGIDEKYVARALAERVPASSTMALADGTVRPGESMQGKPGIVIGSLTKLEYEAVLDGEVHPDDYEELVEEIRRAFGEFGSASVVGRTVTFVSTATNSSGSVRRLQATVSLRGGRTTIRAFEDLRQGAHGAVGGITGGVGGGFGGAMAGLIMGTVNAPLAAVGTLAGIAVLAYSSSRFGVRKWSERKQRELRSAVARIAAKAKELIARRTIASPPASRRLKR
jgi:hypothetical protein